MDDVTITFAVIAAIVVLFVWGGIPVEIVAVGSTVALWATGVLTLDQSLAGFGDPTVVFIATLFIVSESLDATGVTAWAGQQLIDRAGASRRRLIILTMLLVAGLTAIVSVNGAVAALLPVVVVTATRLRLPTSKLLIPLVFAAHAGSMLALTGTPINVLASNAAVEYGSTGFGFFEFALVGIPLVIGAIAIVVLIGDRALPVRTPRTMSVDLSQHARVLVEQYGLDEDTTHLGREDGLVEIIIPPRSPFIGEAAFRGMVTGSGDLAVAAIQRHGEDLGDTPVALAVGDTILFSGPWAGLEAKARDPGLIAVDAPRQVRRQAVPLGLHAREAIVVLVAMVAALATGVVPSAIAGLLAAGALILLGVLSMEQVYRSINWTTVILVGALLPLSTAMFETGAADRIADLLIGLVGDLGPYATLAGLFVVTALFSQLISNTATALIVIPIGIAAADEIGMDIRPVLMCITVGAAAAFLTPVATPVNLMVMGPAGYRFGDYWKLGLPLLGLFFVVAVFLVPVFWPF